MPDGEESPQDLPPEPEEIADRFPQFEVIECLGRGGMGVVYKARQKSLDRWVAIKVLAPERVHEEGFSERFGREAKTLARMSHPNIVTVFDHGEADGLFYIVMEYVDGVNLRDLLREGKMAPEQALTIVPPICEALEYAHGKGVVHRDIKPENLLLDRDGRIKIADFGIASLVGARGEKSGTPPYMAPEQEKGGVDRRADIYALGVVLYEMLTGERPTRDLVAPSSKVAVDGRIDEMVLRALEEEPARRYQTAEEFRSVVATIQAPSAEPASPASARPRGMFRRFWWILLGATLLGPLLGIMAGMAWSYITPKRYEASAMVQVSSASAVTMPQTFYPTTFEAIRARKTLEPVMEELDLARRWDLPSEEVMVRLEKMIETRHLRGTDLIEIRVRDRDAEGAADIANGVVKAFSTRSEPLGVRVTQHQVATAPRKPVSPNLALALLMGAAAGLLLAPLAGLVLVAVLHRVFPVRTAGISRPVSGATSRWALGLMTGVLLGIPLLLALVPGGRHEWVLLFGGLCSVGSLGCAIASWRTRMGRAVGIIWIVIVVVCLALAGGYFALLRGEETTARERHKRMADEARALQAEEARRAGREAFVGRWKWEEEGGGDVVWLLVPAFDEAVVVGSDHEGEMQFRYEPGWKLEGETVVFHESGKENRGEVSEDGRELRFTRADEEVVVFRKTTDAPDGIDPDLVAIEDLAVRMIAAIREADEDGLKSLAVDRTPGWRGALPAFAGELRERHRHLTGSEAFGLWPTEVLVQGDYGLARCTGSAELQGKCVVLSFVKTDEGWRNCLVRSGTDDIPLRGYLAELEKVR